MSPIKLEDYTSQRLGEPSGVEVEGAAPLGSPTGGKQICKISVTIFSTSVGTNSR